MTKYYAQVNYELIAKKPKIKILLKQGWTRHRIYNDLKENKEITCSKASFYRFLHKHFDPKDFIHPIVLDYMMKREAEEKRLKSDESYEIKKFIYDPSSTIPDEEL
ncbi:MAG: hypothetical protein AB7U85_07380 [Alphaproteobacteria bacterium]